MDNRSTIRFAITSGGKRAAYWRLRAGLKQPELFLEREGYGKKFHFSLHALGQWHMKEGHQEQISWARPGEVVPGYTRAVGQGDTLEKPTALPNEIKTSVSAAAATAPAMIAPQLVAD